MIVLKGVRLKDVAEKTGFTVNTVSRALKNGNDISEATKILIRDTAKEMGYICNTLACSLRSGMSKTIAIILGDISNPYFSIITKGIERKASEYGYRTLILNTEEDDALEEEALYSVLSKKVDGVILSPCQKSINSINILRKSDIPFVLLGRHFHDNDMNYVICDDANGGYAATQYLIENGHKKILLLNGPRFLSPAVERYMGYRKALKENGIPFRRQLVKEIAIIPGSGLNPVEEVIREGLDFTAVLAFSDLIAFETVGILSELGLKVPEDISVVGFDNIQSNFKLPFPLTSVDTPKIEIANNSFSLLLSAMEKGDGSYCNKVIGNGLVIRGSTKKMK
jgi:LacI family transcriptional regulator